MNGAEQEETMEQQQVYNQAVAVIKQAILQHQLQATRQVNEVQLALYYGVGRYVSQNSRMGYWRTGAIHYISDKLKAELPGLRGFSATNIKMMRLFYEAWKDLMPDLFIRETATLCIDGKSDIKSSDVSDDLRAMESMAACEFRMGFSKQEFYSISFSHHSLILNKIKTPDERAYYIRLSAAERLSLIQLKNAIAGEAYLHRGRMPNNFAAAMKDSRSALKAIDLFRDEYLLDFINVEELGVRDRDDIDERIVENAIVHNIRDFIMTFGRDFSFIGNQYRIEAFGKEHFIDLLFYNRELSALVAVELKRGPFKAGYLGQLNLYLQMLDDYVKKPQENPSIGIILCKDADKSYVEYAVRDYAKPMGVATYKTGDEMPERLRRALPDAESLLSLL